MTESYVENKTNVSNIANKRAKNNSNFVFKCVFNNNGDSLEHTIERAFKSYYSNKIL
ncbi:MAG: hypothetical protein FWF46_02220 [Oscillospiraceae bacterium]|nr:hypothetical protein [Oscillospiraceae bacterium]